MARGAAGPKTSRRSLKAKLSGLSNQTMLSRAFKLGGFARASLVSVLLACFIGILFGVHSGIVHGAVQAKLESVRIITQYSRLRHDKSDVARDFLIDTYALQLGETFALDVSNSSVFLHTKDKASVGLLEVAAYWENNESLSSAWPNFTRPPLFVKSSASERVLAEVKQKYSDYYKRMLNSNK